MILAGDCIEQMRTLEADSVDAIVTDPPYGLEFMGKDWDSLKSHIGNPAMTNHSKDLPQSGAVGVSFGAPKRNPWCRSCGKYKHAPHASKCFCKEPKWNTRQDEGGRQMQGWHEEWAKEAYRVLKPGGHLLAFGATRTYHRLAAGIEDAGFEIRDTLMWLYGSGFPKSLDVSKAIDKAAGAERKVIGKATGGGFADKTIGTVGHHKGAPDITAPSTEAAKKWQGWGTALKPAVEPIVLARKPLIGTVAENVLTHGTGALNIDASRIGTDGGTQKAADNPGQESQLVYGDGLNGGEKQQINAGRWPANILLDEAAAAMLDEQSGVSESTMHARARVAAMPGYEGGWKPDIYNRGLSDFGGASRFFYVAKASRAERNKGLDRNIHPTVKPVDLMRYLIRLVTPKGGTVLDPFLGSGTTAVAAIEEGVDWIGCEREPEYLNIIRARVAAAQPGMGLALEEQI